MDANIFLYFGCGIMLVMILMWLYGKVGCTQDCSHAKRLRNRTRFTQGVVTMIETTEIEREYLQRLYASLQSLVELQITSRLVHEVEELSRSTLVALKASGELRTFDDLSVTVDDIRHYICITPVKHHDLGIHLLSGDARLLKMKENNYES